MSWNHDCEEKQNKQKTNTLPLLAKIMKFVFLQLEAWKYSLEEVGYPGIDKNFPINWIAFGGGAVF